MIRDETVALFLQGRETWNAWAETMLAGRRALEADGCWEAKRNSSGRLEPANAKTDGWMKSASASFSFCFFRVMAEELASGTEEAEEGDKPARPAGKTVQVENGSVDFDGFIFPGDVWFDNASFSGDASFNGATFLGNVRFDNAAFLGSAWFNNAVFSGYTRFNGAAFAGNAWLDSAAFAGSARFDGTSFSGNAFFGSAKFSSSASFSDTRFLGYSSFGSTTFSGGVRFYEASFSGTAWFNNTAFQNRADFELARFEKKAVFDGIEAERAFKLTGAAFAELPVFSQAEFKQAPDLTDVRFPLPRFWHGFWQVGDAGLATNYRAIRRMAIQGDDYERGRMAFKGELRARRWAVDKLWHPGLWLGFVCDAFADCGRSIVRPANTWLASILLFAAFYWQRAAAGAGLRCEEAGGAAVQALFLSVKNALVIFGGTRDARVNQAYLCLYNGSAEQPHIPPTVTFVETLAQIPVSATLIFLFLLAVKNRFRIK